MIVDCKYSCIELVTGVKLSNSEEKKRKYI